jgi:hypothetical protein
MKKGIFKFSILMLSCTLIFTACNKKKDPQPADDTSAQTQNGNDDSNASSESDAALNDANTAIAGQIAMNGARVAAGLTGAGATYVYDTIATNKRITITYDGITQINGRTRTGTLTATIPLAKHWADTGAVLTLTFTNLKATRVSDGKSITLNGTKTVTNVNGGNIKTLTSTCTGSLVHKIRTTNMVLTFDDGTTRTWNVARTRTITCSSGSLSISITGDTAIGVHSNVAMWGTNRAGNTFYSIISTPVVWKSTTISLNNICTANAYFVPVSGVRVIQGLDHALTITFGVSSTGAIVTTGCPYGLKLDWINAKGESKEVIRPYL